MPPAVFTSVTRFMAVALVVVSGVLAQPGDGRTRPEIGGVSSAGLIDAAGSEAAHGPVGAAGLQTGTCVSRAGPGIAPPARVPSGLPGYHAAWYGQSGYLSLCPGHRATSIVAFYNSGSFGWVAGRMGQAGYLGTWVSEPGQDQPSVLGGDGALGSPATGWPRFNRVAVQPAPYVGPGQIAWFQFTVQAPAEPGTYRLGIRPLIEGTRWLEDYGVFWQVTVLNPDGSSPVPTPGDPAGLTFSIGPGVLAQDIWEVHQGVARVAAYLRASVGGDRRGAATARVFVGSGSEQFCCIATGRAMDIVTSNEAWRSPPAAQPDTWSASAERRELAAHEYVHLWQYDIGGSACMLGPRWLSEGMSESLAYRALVRDGLIDASSIDTYVRRQLREGTYARLSSLETSWPGSASPYQVAYLAVDRLLAASGPLPLRDWCARVGAGQPWRTAFSAAFGESVDAFYARFEAFRAAYVQ